MPDSDDMAAIATAVGSAQIFISSHISSFVFAIFGSKNSSLIEIPLDRMECTTFGEKWVRFAGSNYVSVKRAESCLFQNFSKYVEREVVIGEITEDELRRSIEIAYARATAVGM
jgi:hypothetical protein